MPPEERGSAIPEPGSHEPDASARAVSAPASLNPSRKPSAAEENPGLQHPGGQTTPASSRKPESKPPLPRSNPPSDRASVSQPQRSAPAIEQARAGARGPSEAKPKSARAVMPMRIISVLGPPGQKLSKPPPARGTAQTASSRGLVGSEPPRGKKPLLRSNPPAPPTGDVASAGELARGESALSNVPALVSDVPQVASRPPVTNTATSDQSGQSSPRPPDDIAPTAANLSEVEGSEDALEALGDEDLTLISSNPPAAAVAPKRRPPKPPLRSSFSEASSPVNEDGSPRKLPWYEEFFSEDFARAQGTLSEPQLRRDVDFIEKSLGLQHGSVILDLACGAGQHAVALSERSYKVVGYDLSAYQLTLASEFARSRDQQISFLQGDMREMAFENMFDGVVCWGASFGYFEEEKNLLVLRRILKALKPGGTLLLDVPNRDFAVSQQPSQNWFEGEAAVCMDDMHVNFITSRLLVKRTLMMEDGRNRECVSSMRIFCLHELGRMLHDVGFRVASVSGAVTTPEAFLGPESPRLIMLANKP